MKRVQPPQPRNRGGTVTDSGTVRITFDNKTLDQYSWKYDDGTFTITVEAISIKINSVDSSWSKYSADIKKLVIKGDVSSIGSSVISSLTSLEEVTIYCDCSLDKSLFSSVSKVTKMSHNWVTKDENTNEMICSNCEFELQGKAGDNCTWVYRDGTLTISGSGAMKDYGTVTIDKTSNGVVSPWYTLRNNITNIVIGDGVTSIGQYAFWQCPVTEVTIPDCVTSIGTAAFWECTSLKKITMTDSVKTIGDFAFEGCVNLTDVTLSKYITSIGNGLFQNCTSLKTVTIPDGVTLIDNYAFFNCTSLTEITIPQVTRIGKDAFKDCISLKEITIKVSDAEALLLGIEDQTSEYYENYIVFSGCTALESIKVPCNSNYSNYSNIGYFTLAGAPSTTQLSYTVHNYKDDEAIVEDCNASNDQRRFKVKGGYVYSNSDNFSKIISTDSGVRVIDLTKINAVEDIDAVKNIDNAVFTSDVFTNPVVVYVAEGATINTENNNKVVVKYVTNSEKLGININKTEDSNYKFSVVVNTDYFGGSKTEGEYPLYLDEVDVIDNDELEASQITYYYTADDDDNIYFKVNYTSPTEESTVRGQVQVMDWDGENPSDTIVYYVTEPYTVDTYGNIVGGESV